MVPSVSFCCTSWSCPEELDMECLLFSYCHAPSQSRQFPGRVCFDVSVTSPWTYPDLLLPNSTSPRPQKLSCLSPWILSLYAASLHGLRIGLLPPNRLEKSLIMPDYRLVPNGWEPGQKIKCWGFISTDLRGMYRWASQFLFIDWNSWSYSNRFRSAAKVSTSILRGPAASQEEVMSAQMKAVFCTA